MLTKAQGLMICGGDMNVRVNPKLDSSRGPSSQSTSLCRKMEKMKEKTENYSEKYDNIGFSPSFLWDACKAILQGKITAKTDALKK